MSVRPNSICKTLREKKSAQKHSLASLIATSHDWSQQFVSPYPDLPITTIRQCSNKNARLRFSGCGLAPESTELSNGPSHRHLPSGGLGHFRTLRQQRSATVSTAIYKRLACSAGFLTKDFSFSARISGRVERLRIEPWPAGHGPQALNRCYGDLRPVRTPKGPAPGRSAHPRCRSKLSILRRPTIR